MNMRSYTSMELDDEDKLDRAIPQIADKPDYPWGLRISLTESELQKLECDPGDEPEVGDLLHFAAFAKVTSFSKNDTGNGSERRVELQIVMMSCIEDESTEFEDDD